jgi:hypothetical protein
MSLPLPSQFSDWILRQMQNNWESRPTVPLAEGRLVGQQNLAGLASDSVAALEPSLKALAEAVRRRNSITDHRVSITCPIGGLHTSGTMGLEVIHSKKLPTADHGLRALSRAVLRRNSSPRDVKLSPLSFSERLAEAESKLRSLPMPTECSTAQWIKIVGDAIILLAEVAGAYGERMDELLTISDGLTSLTRQRTGWHLQALPIGSSKPFTLIEF